MKLLAFIKSYIHVYLINMSFVSKNKFGFFFYFNTCILYFVFNATSISIHKQLKSVKLTISETYESDEQIQVTFQCIIVA